MDHRGIKKTKPAFAVGLLQFGHEPARIILGHAFHLGEDAEYSGRPVSERIFVQRSIEKGKQIAPNTSEASFPEMRW